MSQKKSPLAFLARIEGLPVATVLLILYLAFVLTAPTVFTRWPIYGSFLQTVPYTILIYGLGLTFVITAGEIDLSFPAIVAFSGFVFSWAFKTFDPAWSAWLGLVLALAGGAFIGWINGLMVAKIGVPSIMATLAAQFFWYGITVLLVGGLSWSIPTIRTNIVHTIFVSRLFGVLPAQALWVIALAVFLWFILNRHTFGEAVMFIGDNPDVARVMGINVELTKIKLFTMNGAIAAFGGILLTMDVNAFFPTQGQGFLLWSLAAVFIGGTSIAGGLGSIVGTVFGAFIIGSLEAGVVATGASGYWVKVIEGAVMGASMILNLVIGQGRLSGLSQRLRHWGVPIRSDTSVQVSREDNPALK
jgi:simple sugar transport system permease protein